MIQRERKKKELSNPKHFSPARSFAFLGLPSSFGARSCENRELGKVFGVVPAQEPQTPPAAERKRSHHRAQLRENPEGAEASSCVLCAPNPPKFCSQHLPSCSTSFGLALSGFFSSFGFGFFFFHSFFQAQGFELINLFI